MNETSSKQVYGRRLRQGTVNKGKTAWLFHDGVRHVNAPGMPKTKKKEAIFEMTAEMKAKLESDGWKVWEPK